MGEREQESKPEPLFELGQIVGTPRALAAMGEAEQEPVELLLRHVTGDWGNLDDEDKRENELSVKVGFRILSAYKLETGQKVWVITEWDRSVTTISIIHPKCGYLEYWASKAMFTLKLDLPMVTLQLDLPCVIGCSMIAITAPGHGNTWLDVSERNMSNDQREFVTAREKK